MELYTDLALHLLVLCLGGTLLYRVKKSEHLLSSKELFRLPLTNSDIEFTITEKGIYAIYILGGDSITTANNFEVLLDKKLKETDEHVYLPIKLTYNWIKFPVIPFESGGQIIRFNIAEPGDYALELRNIEDLIVKESGAIFERMFQQKLPVEKIKIMIRKSQSIGNIILVVLSFVLGFYLISTGFFFLADWLMLNTGTVF